MSVGTGRLAPAAGVVEQVLEAAGPDGCIVLVEDRSEAELRFANNTVTTNGTRRDRTVTVIALREVEGGTGVGIASRSGAGDATDLLRRAETIAAGAPPADDAAPLVTPAGPDAGSDFGEGPVTTSLAGLGDVLAELGDAFGRARASGNRLAGFAEHKVSTLYLGTSAGVRLRHVQPTGKLEVVARSDDGSRSAWAATGAADLADVRLEELEDRLLRRLGWAERKVELEPGRYEVVIPPDAVADLMVLAGAATSGREAEEGRSVFSAPGGGTRVGESLSPHPFTLRSDPLERDSSASRFSPRRRRARTCLSSTTVSHWSAPTGSPVVGSRDCSTTARRRNDRVPKRLRRSTTSSSNYPERPAASTISYRGPSAACCSRASGTSGKWTRRRCC